MRGIRLAGWVVMLSAGSAMAAEMESGADATSSTTPMASATSSTPISHDKAVFDALDTNHDGYISQSEAQQGGIPDYSAADLNGDGKLNQNEYSMGAKNSVDSSSSTSSMSQSKPDSGVSSSAPGSSY